jgi:hypothetical protein
MKTDHTEQLLKIMDNYSITYKGCTIYKTTDELFIWNGREFGSLAGAKKEIDKTFLYVMESISRRLNW